MRNRYLYYITLMAVLGLTSEWVAAQEKTQYAPRLVVNINIDQLRTDYMEAFSPLYSTNGFKMLMQQGMVFTNARYPFTPVDRASAISSVATGVTPYYHGIVGQRWLDRETLRPVYCVDDNPSQLQTSTIADELKVATEGNSVAFAVAPYRDAAILSAGHAADGAFWIDDESGQWVTSQYYLSQPPAWLMSFNDLHAPANTDSKLVWEPVIPLSGTFNYYQHIGDQKPFKHKLTGSRRYIQLKSSGLINEYVTEMAQQVVTQQLMGYDRVTDLLSVTYYAGNFDHKTMTDCQLELQDTYVRLDREIARLIKTLQQRLGAEHVLFVITSTGYCDQESTDYQKYRIPSGTFYINRTASLLNMYFGAIWGQGRWVESCFRNQMFLNHKLLESKRVSLTDALQRAQEFLSQVAGVRNIYTSLQLIQGNNEEIFRVRNGFNAERSGDILIDVAAGWHLQNEDTQETELSRASFIQFPIIIYGAGTKAERITDVVTTDRIAPTIAKTIRIRAPNACSSEPLF